MPVASQTRDYASDGPWTPKTPEEKSYFGADKPPPVEAQSVFWHCFLEPLLVWLGLYSIPDTSYGRLNLPYSPEESKIRSKKEITVHDYQVFLDEPGTLVEGPLKSKPGRRWISYSTYYNEEAARENNIAADLVLCHGYNDYSGGMLIHAQHFISQGFRIILADLPGHGRSSGLHGLVENTNRLPEAIHTVLNNLQIRDNKTGFSKTPRKCFIVGQSMGGYTVLRYASLHRKADGSWAGRKIDGVIALCPMLKIAPETRPPYVVEIFGHMVKSFAGRFPLIHTMRGKISPDPWVEQRFLVDPQTYHGKLRIASGFSFLAGIDQINKAFDSIQAPLLLIHGTADRVTDHRVTKELFEVAPSQDKTLELLDGYEHVMLRLGHDAEDDQERQHVLRLMSDWLRQRAV